jgi:hypothetical protein
MNNNNNNIFIIIIVDNGPPATVTAAAAAAAPPFYAVQALFILAHCRCCSLAMMAARISMVRTVISCSSVIYDEFQR